MKTHGLVIAAMLSASIVGAEEFVHATNWAKLAKLSATRPTTNVVVINGTDLEIEGTRCRLLGIKLHDDAASQTAAKRFLELYMRNYGGYFSIYNSHSPINSKDGLPLIWLRGHGNGGWAQEALVQAGLAKFDYALLFDGYKFQTASKAGTEDFDWKGCLRNAEASFTLGQKPDINFKWPDESTNRISLPKGSTH